MTSSSSPIEFAEVQSKDYISDFMKNYDRYDYQVKFDKLARIVVGKFEQHMANDFEDTHIKYKIFSRAKDHKSLEEKLISQATKTPFKSKEQLLDSKRLWDLAGVRVLAYFPDDIPIIAKEFSEVFQILGKPILKRSTREYHQPEKPDRNMAVTAASARSQLDKYSKGTWAAASNMEHVTQDWKHLGYQAVHFHVEVEDKSLFPNPLPYQKRVEVQITTFVMHAWSEVEHDIIYKNPYRLPPNPRMDRMLDAVNGLSITSELLLSELQHAYRAQRDHEHKGLTSYDLKSWFLEFYFHHPVVGKRLRDSNYTSFTINLLQSPFFREKSSYKSLSRNLTTRAQVKSLLAGYEREHHLDSSEDGFDLLKLLLQQRYMGEMNDQLRHYSLINYEGASASPIHLLYKLLVVSSAYSIWTVLERKRRGSDTNKSPCLDFRTEIEEINQIIIGKTSFRLMEEAGFERMEMLCSSYLGQKCCDEHEVARNLAQMSFFACRGFGKYPQSSMRVHDEKTSTSSDMFDPEKGFWPTPVDFRFLTDENFDVDTRTSSQDRHSDLGIQDKESFYHEVLNTNYFGTVVEDWNEFTYRVPTMYEAPKSVWWQYIDPPEASMVWVRREFPDSSAKLAWIKPRDIRTYLVSLLSDDSFAFRKWVQGRIGGHVLDIDITSEPSQSSSGSYRPDAPENIPCADLRDLTLSSARYRKC